MFFLLFACWVIFNQSFTLEIAIFGIIISAAVYMFVCKFMDYSVKKDLFILKKIGKIIGYVGTLLWEVLKANVLLFDKFFLHKSLREPVIVKFTTDLKTRSARSILCNSITLTPGTITTNLEGNTITVHCVDKSLAVGLDKSVFEEKLLKLEEGFDK